jgi:hypothetical protein
MFPKIIRDCFLIIALPISSSSQTYNDNVHEIFSGRQPSARAEALGRSAVSVEGDIYSCYFNPAGLASLSGPTVGGSYAEPYYGLKAAKYYYGAAAYRFPSVGSIGVSYFQFRYGNFELRDEVNRDNPMVSADAYIFGLSLATNVFDVIDIGLNLGYYLNEISEIGAVHETGSAKATALLVDVGVKKSILLPFNGASKQSITFGACVKNIGAAKVAFIDEAQAFSLPVQLSIGGTYDIAIGTSAWNSSLIPLKALATIEYQDFLNYRYRTGYHIGIEIKEMEILAVRIGYYSESLNTNGFPGNKSDLSSVTYGFGLSVPLAKLTNGSFPLNITLDYTYLRQPSYSNSPAWSQWGNFTSLSFKANYIF